MPQKKEPPPMGGKKRRGSSHRMDADDDIEEWKKSKQLLKPKDQVELLDYELKEIIGRTLVATNKQVPENIVEFNYMQGSFVPLEHPTNYVPVYQKEGCYIHKRSEEARRQYEELGLDLALLEIAEDEGKEVLEESHLSGPEIQLLSDEGYEGEEAEDEEAKDAEQEREEGEAVEVGQEKTDEDQEDTISKPSHGKKLTNQFNFCERAALSSIPPIRNQESQTVPPPTENFSENVLQWVIYDSYQKDFEEHEAEKERERQLKEKEKEKIGKGATAPALAGKKQGRAGFNEEVLNRVFESWKVLERMINLNTYDEIAKDYKYWEDPSDEFREEEGTLLPLWKYSLEKLKDMTITHLLWNPWYYDLFVACYGYLDFLKPSDYGCICLYTIKNPSYPESICVTDSSVMCADIHPKFPYMLVCGLYDGNVRVYNVQASTKIPAFVTKSYHTKSAGIVWSVKWVPDLPDGELNFYSVSNDGRVKNYVLMQNELAVTNIIKLVLDRPPALGPDGTLVQLISCATCLVMHPTQEDIYLVGTDEGFIYKCSVNYSSQVLVTYKAHNLPVYAINFNYFNSDIFISCSGDWRIKIWDDGRLEPLFSFDVGAIVSDVQWAPYSSTVFAAVTFEGKAYVFDLNLNKYKPICIQAVVSKKRNKLTTLAFNNNAPIMIVGDDKGTVSALKLSPNLRIPCKPPKKQQNLDQKTLQIMKLDKLLSVVREPLTLSVDEDVTTTMSNLAK